MTSKLTDSRDRTFFSLDCFDTERAKERIGSRRYGIRIKFLSPEPAIDWLEPLPCWGAAVPDIVHPSRDVKSRMNTQGGLARL